MRYLVWFILLVLVPICCNNQYAVLTSHPLLVWKTAREANNRNFLSTIKPIIYNDIVVYSEKSLANDANSPLVAYNKYTGERLWRWNDFFQKSHNNFRQARQRYRFKHILIMAHSGRLYAINLKNGATVWKTRDAVYGNNSVTGINNVIFHVHWKYDYSEAIIYQIMAETGERQQVFAVSREDGFVPYLKTPIPFLYNNELFLAITNTRYQPTTHQSFNTLTVYNSTKNKILYTKRVDNPNYDGSISTPVMYKNYLYVGADNALYCIDWQNGHTRWQKSIVPGTAGLHFYNNRLYVGAEASFNNTWMCLNPDNGGVIWQKKRSGTCSSMAFYNNTIYCTNNNLYAIDATTGNVLLTYPSPDEQNNTSAFFDSTITIDAKTGYLYANTFVNAYCFKIP